MLQLSLQMGFHSRAAKPQEVVPEACGQRESVGRVYEYSSEGLERFCQVALRGGGAKYANS